MHAVGVLGCCLLLFVGSSCNRQSDNNDGSPSVAVEEKGSMSEKVDLPKEALVRQRTSGGLLPVEREWLFYADGKIRHPNGEFTRLKEGGIENLLNPSQFSWLAKAATEYPPPAGSADFITMKLTIRGPGGVRTITAADSNDSMPDELWDLWNKLQNAARRSLGKPHDK